MSCIALLSPASATQNGLRTLRGRHHVMRGSQFSCTKVINVTRGGDVTRRESFPLQFLEGRTMESQFGGQQHMFSSAEGAFKPFQPGPHPLELSIDITQT